MCGRLRFLKMNKEYINVDEVHCYLFLSPVKLNSHDAPCVCVCVCVFHSHRTQSGIAMYKMLGWAHPQKCFSIMGKAFWDVILSKDNAGQLERWMGKHSPLSLLPAPSFSLNLSVLPLYTASPITSLFTQINASNETNKETVLAYAHTNTCARTHTHKHWHSKSETLFSLPVRTLSFK